MGFSLPMDNFKNMSAKNKYSYKTTAEIFNNCRDYSFLDAWLVGQDTNDLSEKKKY
jgi:hypothetical protein